MNNSPVKSELYVALEMVELTQFLPFTNLLKTRINKDRITNLGIYHVRTNILKGINYKIKEIKRLAYGFRNLDYFFH